MSSLSVAVIGGTGQTGRAVIDGLLASKTDFAITCLTRATSIDSAANKILAAKGVNIVGYDLHGPQEDLVAILKPVDVLISCITWEQLEDQLVWIAAAKKADVKRFVPSEWGEGSMIRPEKNDPHPEQSTRVE